MTTVHRSLSEMLRIVAHLHGDVYIDRDREKKYASIAMIGVNYALKPCSAIFSEVHGEREQPLIIGIGQKQKSVRILISDRQSCFLL